MLTRTRRGGLAALMVLLLAGFGLWGAPSASADTVLPIKWDVNASTHLKSLNLDVVVPTGTFEGTINLTTGELTGNLTLPPATTTMKLWGIPLANATFAMQATGPITGHVDLATLQVTVNSSFNFSITKVAPTFLPGWNLVGNHCHGASPITVNMSGAVSLTGASTFSSTYTVPNFTSCGFITPILNLIAPGPGNTFTATFAPPAV